MYATPLTKRANKSSHVMAWDDGEIYSNMFFVRTSRFWDMGPFLFR